MDFSDLECAICSHHFSDDHCPRILPCSHTLCGSCIDGVISSQNKTCPLCRKEFAATSAKNLAVNLIALNMAKQFTSVRLKRKRQKGRKGSLCEIINCFKEKVPISDIQDKEEETVRALAYFDALKVDTLKFKEEIQKNLDQVQELCKHIDKVSGELQSNLDVTRERKEKLQDLLGKLGEASSYASAGHIMDEAEKILRDGQEDFTGHQEPPQKNENKRPTIKQVTDVTKVRMSGVTGQMLKTVEDFAKDSVVKVSDLKGLLDCLRWKSQREIFAVQDFQGRQWVAKLKIGSNNRVSLSHFKEGRLPPKCFVTEVGSLIEKSPRRVFLDLDVDGVHLGRIIIMLDVKGNLALNFLHLCAGDRGPTYVNARVVQVANLGVVGECVNIGEHLRGGGVPVLSEVDHIYEEMSWKVGQVRMSNLSGSASKFTIVTRDHPTFRRRGCFGMVEEGLNILKDAILNCPDVKRIKVTDCGLIFTL